MSTHDYMPLSGREFPRFSGIKTFFRLPYVPSVAGSDASVTGSAGAIAKTDWDVSIVGVPYDGGTSYRPGSRFAPTRLRECSSLGRGFHMTRAYSLFQKLKVCDGGDCPVVPIDLSQTYAKIEKHFSDLLATGRSLQAGVGNNQTGDDKTSTSGVKKFLAVGGDHSITLPLLRALSKFHGTKLSLIHFDAHLDTYPAAWGCEYHHGSFLRHVVEDGLVDSKQCLQVGIRGPLAGSDDLDFVKKYGLKVATMDDIRRGSLSDFLATLPVFDKLPTYITFDIDCLDPSCAPGTGTPVPGGLTTYETQQILRALKVKNLVGADIVEVSPPFDPSEITSLAEVDTMFELLCMMGNG